MDTEQLAGSTAFLDQLARKGGPDPCEYEILENWINRIGVSITNGEAEKRGELWRNLLGIAAASRETMQGFVWCKPHGYAGDYEIIDRIYSQWISPDPRLAKWDYLFHSRQAPKAVRNRKGYFIDWLADAEHRNAEGLVRVLNVGSGPARDVLEFFESHPKSKVFIDCVDHSVEAITYAEKLCHTWLSRVKFHGANALRFRPPNSPNLIWSAGLLDYLANSLFVRLLNSLWADLLPKGEIGVGNFSPNNSSRHYMEIFGGWRLHHRTAKCLLALATEAGLPESAIEIRLEPERVNLFLHARKPFNP